MHITSIESSRRALPSWQTTNGRTITFDNRRGRGYQAWIPPPGYRAGRCLELKFSEVASPRPSLLHRLLQPDLLRHLSVETSLVTAPLVTASGGPDSLRTGLRTKSVRTKEKPHHMGGALSFANHSATKPSPSICPLALPVEAPQFRLQPPHSHAQRRNLRGAFVAQLD